MNQLFFIASIIIKLVRKGKCIYVTRMPKSLALTELECKETRCQDFNKKLFQSKRESKEGVV